MQFSISARVVESIFSGSKSPAAFPSLAFSELLCAKLIFIFFQLLFLFFLSSVRGLKNSLLPLIKVLSDTH